MLILLVEIFLIALLVLFYLRRELAISMRDFRHGDVIWVRDRSLKPERAVLSKWNGKTFCYMLDGSCDLRFKKWFFLARNESYLEREKESAQQNNKTEITGLAGFSRAQAWQFFLIYFLNPLQKRPQT
ncbi:hypothetical protein AAE02nite_42410 [Adhaeribacter aerolatus]|uniref:Uncharacterized protein n=1 Tax=Adhaeribacter aerolatus TaxID=670289 RepID=A0A512B467_9BACT|nr:hypothetical protein [Adhaeribacter aerolatus]GEO06577.1 hypothetical protein AAE02nite_42410 [Adhaeribacter aerolatus]